MSCKCGKETYKKNGRCKSCSNKERKGKYKCNNFNKLAEKNPKWKGDNVSYTSLHAWLRRNFGNAKKCVWCDVIENIQWANLSGEYKRDIKDYLSLCIKCHRKFDKGKNSIMMRFGKNRMVKCEHVHKDDPEDSCCIDCHCGNKIKKYDEGDDTMEMCEECR